jgi:hypothetical protein
MVTTHLLTSLFYNCLSGDHPWRYTNNGNCPKKDIAKSGYKPYMKYKSNFYILMVTNSKTKETEWRQMKIFL